MNLVSREERIGNHGPFAPVAVNRCHRCGGVTFGESCVACGEIHWTYENANHGEIPPDDDTMVNVECCVCHVHYKVKHYVIKNTKYMKKNMVHKCRSCRAKERNQQARFKGRNAGIVELLKQGYEPEIAAKMSNVTATVVWNVFRTWRAMDPTAPPARRAGRPRKI
jgi:hypothetical protein